MAAYSDKDNYSFIGTFTPCMVSMNVIKKLNGNYSNMYKMV